MAKIRVEDGPGMLTPERVEQILGRWKPELLRFGYRLGMIGGLVGHQVGPFLAGGSGGVHAFRHDISLLGEVPCLAGGRWSQAAFDRLANLAGFGERARARPLLHGDRAGESLPVEVTAMQMDTRLALRWLLAGSDGHPMWGDPAKVIIGRNEAATRHGGNPATRKALGVDGALALQPTFLFDLDQFLGVRASLRRRHLHSEFGRWEGATVPDGDGAGMPPGPKGAPGDGLRALNRRRQEEAADEVARLLPLAGAVHRELAAELGRRPGRELFARRLAEVSPGISRRRVVDLLVALGDASGI